MNRPAIASVIAVNVALALALLAHAIPLRAADEPVHLDSLPAAVQQAIKEETRNGVLLAVLREQQGNRTTYEAETRVDGHTRDVAFDVDGKVVSVEEEVAIDVIPAPARRAIEKAAAGGGKVEKLEKVTEGGAISYEGEIRKGRHTKEVRVDAEGRAVRR